MKFFEKLTGRNRNSQKAVVTPAIGALAATQEIVPETPFYQEVSQRCIRLNTTTDKLLRQLVPKAYLLPSKVPQ